MIKPIPQTNKELKKVIQCIGCFFRSSQAIAELEANKTLTTSQINSLWDWAKSERLIDDRNYIVASAPIANKTLKILGVKNKKFIEVATSHYGNITYYKSIPKKMQKPKYFIRKIINQFDGTHFLVTDEKGTTIFDPDNSAVEIKECYTICYYLQNV